LSARQVAASLPVSRSSVGEYDRRFAASGLNWPLPEDLSDRELERRLFPPPPSVPADTRVVPDWAAVHQERRRTGVTLMRLWEEYRAADPEGFGYSWFCKRYEAWSGSLDVVMRQTHRAGETLFVDDAGQTVEVVDPARGAIRTAQIREAWRAERGRAAPGRRRRVRAAAGAKRPWSRSREGGMPSASDTPSSHASQGRAQPDRAPRAHVVAQRGPERGEPGPQQVVAKERVRPAAGAPGRIHERHATLRSSWQCSGPRTTPMPRRPRRKVCPIGSARMCGPSLNVRAFAYFDGVPAILVPDNLRSGVSKTHRGEPDLNPTDLELANHYGVAVVPAWVRKPGRLVPRRKPGCRASSAGSQGPCAIRPSSA
jgi:transposase